MGTVPLYVTHWLDVPTLSMLAYGGGEVVVVEAVPAGQAPPSTFEVSIIFPELSFK
jgi:hypothetical protein